MQIEKSEILHTPFGKARITNGGYYQITSPTGKYFLKYLHRLIWEKFYNTTIPKGYIIHHKNGNKTDNCILNLQLMKTSEHSKHHNIGNTFSDECKEKMRNAHLGEKNHFYGKKHSKKSKIQMSKSNNSIGYFRVYKMKQKDCKQGFIYVYRYTENGKTKKISSVDIKTLEQKVKDNGLDWIKF